VKGRLSFIHYSQLHPTPVPVIPSAAEKSLADPGKIRDVSTPLDMTKGLLEMAATRFERGDARGFRQLIF
jgi:hypothetical protein